MSAYPVYFILQVISKELEGEITNLLRCGLEYATMQSSLGKKDFTLIIGLKFGQIPNKLMKVNRGPIDLNSVYSRFIHRQEINM